MKLLNHTSKYFVLILLPILTIWSVIFYYAMLDEIYDSLDDGLDNQKLLLIQRLETDPSIIDRSDLEEWNHSISPISEGTYQNFKESFRDTLMYMQNEEDYEPVRIHESAFKYQNNYYKVKLVTSMVEEDDLVEDLVRYLIILYVLLIVIIVAINNLMLKQIWKPFHNLIGQLRDFRIETNTEIHPKPTSIEEFKLLNETIIGLISTSRERFVEQKHFIENASHELQTPLAISINKLELFLENNPLNDAQLADMASILDNLGRLTRLNKSLLLLSKIENQQFNEEETIDFKDLTTKIIEDFYDFSAHKTIQFNINTQTELRYRMNKDLAVILVTNLIKNAIVHGKSSTTITIEITSNLLTISNIGNPEALNASHLFLRFKKTNTDKKSTGLGLAISKAIADKYHIKIDYFFDGMHQFSIKFPN